MSGVRRRNGRCSGGLGGESGGRNSHKITLEFGEDLKKAMEALAPTKERKVGAKAEDAAGASDTAEEAGLNEGMAPWVYPGCRPSTRMRVGLVDSASEEILIFIRMRQKNASDFRESASTEICGACDG